MRTVQLIALGATAAAAFQVAPSTARRVARLSSTAEAEASAAAAPTAACKPFDASVEWKPEGMVDEAALLKDWDFPIDAETLVNRAKWVIAEPELGMRDASVLAKDFEFCAPVIGPLDTKAFLGALDGFKLEDAFPDMCENYHGFRADPLQPGRIWWATRTAATHNGKAGAITGEPTGKKLQFPPQSYSMIFNADGKVKEFTVGYPIDRRVGNTGGLGGAFGYFYGVGKPLPIPECKPYKPSRQLRFLNFLQKFAK